MIAWCARMLQAYGNGQQPGTTGFGLLPFIVRIRGAYPGSYPNPIYLEHIWRILWCGFLIWSAISGGPPTGGPPTGCLASWSLLPGSRGTNRSALDEAMPALVGSMAKHGPINNIDAPMTNVHHMCSVCPNRCSIFCKS